MYFVLVRCKIAFDFSDHITFYAVHYMLPSSMELTLLYSKIRLSQTPYGWCYTLSVLSCFIIITISLQQILQTCIYFHTPLECFIALLIVIPVYLFWIFYSSNGYVLQLTGLERVP